MLKIRAFRAIDDEDTCLRFMEGHARVLTDYGITNISTNNSEWKDSPHVYGVIAENEQGVIIGGMRLHLTNAADVLPLEKAVGDQDTKIADLIYSYSLGVAAEACGLWNAREAAGYGVSILLVRALLVIAYQLRLESVFTLCATYTVYITKQMGSSPIDSIGDNGVLIYPVINYKARFFQNTDVSNLSAADEQNRTRIMELRQTPNQIATELVAKYPVEVRYNLLIPNLNILKEYVVVSVLQR